ncbi:MAG TPA: hypothetical protein VFC56_10420 [Stellaceae bacterium]|nr:hypothetical protein [Stellaceae bacterium]
MNRFLLAGLALAVGVGTAAVADAQTTPPVSSATTQSLYDFYPMSPSSPLDTTRRDVLANPSCGAANPQGGIPSAVTWGSCP